jgi:uncharacterized membrane protein
MATTMTSRTMTMTPMTTRMAPATTVDRASMVQAITAVGKNYPRTLIWCLIVALATLVVAVVQ